MILNHSDILVESKSVYSISQPFRYTLVKALGNNLNLWTTWWCYGYRHPVNNSLRVPHEHSILVPYSPYPLKVIPTKSITTNLSSYLSKENTYKSKFHEKKLKLIFFFFFKKRQLKSICKLPLMSNQCQTDNIHISMITQDYKCNICVERPKSWKIIAACCRMLRRYISHNLYRPSKSIAVITACFAVGWRTWRSRESILVPCKGNKLIRDKANQIH